MTLLELFSRYPGGVTELARAVGVSRQALYQLAWGHHAHPPVDLLRRIRAAYRVAWRVPSETELRRMWEESRRDPG